MEKDASAGNSDSPGSSTTQSVQLQRYAITPFHGDYRDWIRFWNQFEVEVDGAKISEISKFNYLLELVKGQPREDILGLPHTVKGYQEAKKILQTTYGNDFKVHKALIKEMESLHSIRDIRRLDWVIAQQTFESCTNIVYNEQTADSAERRVHFDGQTWTSERSYHSDRR